MECEDVLNNRPRRHPRGARKDQAHPWVAPGALPNRRVLHSTTCRCLPRRRSSHRRGETRRKAPKCNGHSLAPIPSGRRPRVEATRNFCSVVGKHSRNHGHGNLRRGGLPPGVPLVRSSIHHLICPAEATRVLLPFGREHVQPNVDSQSLGMAGSTRLRCEFMRN